MPKINLLTKKQFIRLTLFFCLWRVVLFGVGAVADQFLKYSPTFPYFDSTLVEFVSPRWLYSWANFDGVHYITIGQKGYVGTGLVQAFFPLLPYIMLHTLHTIFGGSLNLLITGLIITNVFAYLLTLLWYIFVKEFWGSKMAWTALKVLFLFPTAFFLGALYTESLFLFLVFAAFWAAKKEWWLLVGMATLLATATRIVGVFLVPALLSEVILQGLSHKQITYYVSHLPQLVLEVFQILIKKWLAVVCILLGLIGILSYMSFLQGEFHDPLYFAHVQAAFGNGREQTVVLYPQVVWRSIKILLTSRPFNLHYLTYIEEFLAGVVGFIALLWSIKYVRFSYVVFSLGAFLLPTLTGTFSSMSRYLLVCFAICLFITKFIQKSRWRVILWFSFSVVTLLINTVMFIQGYWVA